MKLQRTIASRSGIAVDLLSFFWQRRWWWLTPVVLMMLLLAGFLVFAQSSALAPFLYSLF